MFGSLCSSISHTVPLLYAFLHLASSAPAPSRFLPDLVLPTNLTGDSNSNCASSQRFPTWSASDWNIHDCFQAVNRLYLKEVWNRPDREFEFVAKGASATKPNLDPQRTPRKYTVGSCVLTIMMLEWFTPSELPNGRGHPQQLMTDESTYRKIFDAAKGIEAQCTETRFPGWARIGDKSAMGVFVWATNSKINELTPGFDALSTMLSTNLSRTTSVQEIS